MAVLMVPSRVVKLADLLVPYWEMKKAAMKDVKSAVRKAALMAVR